MALLLFGGELKFAVIEKYVCVQEQKLNPLNPLPPKIEISNYLKRHDVGISLIRITTAVIQIAIVALR